MSLTNERQARIKEAVALLNILELGPVANFLTCVYVEGLYSDPKVYSHYVKPHLQALNKTILKLAVEGGIIPSNQASLARKIFNLAAIGNDLNGHKYRADRIVEDIKAREAQQIQEIEDKINNAFAPRFTY